MSTHWLNQPRTPRTSILKAISTAGVIGISTALLAACGTSSSSPSSAASAGTNSSKSGALAPGTYTFGFNDASTGPVAFAGIDYIRGAQLAASEINSSHALGKGVRISLEEKNGGSVASSDVEIARQFVAQSNLLAAFGSILTPDAQAVKPVYTAGKMPYDIYGATDPNLATPPYIFRTAPLPQYSNESLAKEYLAAAKPKSVEYVVTSDNSGMETQLSYFKKPFEQANIKDLGTVNTLANQTDFLAPAEAVISKHPNVVVVSCLQTPEAAVIKALREGGYKGTILGNATISSPTLYKSYGQWIKGIPFGVHFGPQMQGQIQRAFTSAYEKKYHAEPSTYSAQGAIAVQFLAAGLAKAGTHPTRKSLASALAEVTSLQNDIYGAVTVTNGQLKDPRVLALDWNSQGKLVIWSAHS